MNVAALFVVLVVTVTGEEMVDVFSSTSEMAALARREEVLVARLREYKEQLEGRIARLRAGEPVDGREVERGGEELASLLGALPKEAQLEGAANGIFLLQETYDLDITALAGGAVKAPRLSTDSYTARRGLEARDTDFLGKIAYNRGFYDRAVQWFQATLSIAEKEELPANQTKIFRNQLRTTMKTHDKTLDTKGPAGNIAGHDWRTNPLPFDEKLRKKKKYKKASTLAAFSPSLNQENHEHVVWDQFNRLCRGEELRSPNITKELGCQLLHYHSPYLRLGPFKMDVQSLVPQVVVFRDLMSSSEMTHYRTVASARGLARSQHGMLQSKGGSGASVKRTSKQTWLTEVVGARLNLSTWSIGPYQTGDTIQAADPVALGVAARISLATRLYNMDFGGGEPFQIANYGIGGVYNHHPDPHGYHNPQRPHRDEVESQEVFIRGDRLATVMAYLSPVSLGGATVFPNAGVAIQPEQGSAAFWWNLYSNGITDSLTVHGGCPVLVGSKWITNKWIRWHDQSLKLPCRRKGFERQPLLENSLCTAPSYSAPPFTGLTPGQTYRPSDPSYPVCSINHQTLIDPEWYYNKLKEFSGFT